MGMSRGLPSRIRDARKAAGLTQVELAEVLNVSRETIQNWEAGKSEPRGNDLVVVERWLADEAARTKGTLRGGDESGEPKG